MSWTFGQETKSTAMTQETDPRTAQFVETVFFVAVLLAVSRSFRCGEVFDGFARRQLSWLRVLDSPTGVSRRFNRPAFIERMALGTDGFCDLGVPLDQLHSASHHWLSFWRCMTPHFPSSHQPPRRNKTTAGNGSKTIGRFSNVLRSPSPDPKRSPKPRHDYQL